MASIASSSRPTSQAIHDEEWEEKQRLSEVWKIKLCIAVSFTLMLVEIVVGYQFSCLALVADSYHMLNDVAAFLVQLYSRQISALKRPHTRETTGFTYGFARTQFIANLINGSLLLALCLTLVMESVRRLFEPETLFMAPIVVLVAVLALIWNIINFFMFGGTGHTHSHSHTHSHELSHPSIYRRNVIASGISARYDLHRSLAPANSSNIGHSLRKRFGIRKTSSPVESAETHEADAHDERDMTHTPMTALARHAAADAVGNVAVIIDGIATWLLGPKSGWTSGRITTWRGVVIVDPLCALVVCWIIVKHAFPLITASSYALMQATPPGRARALRDVLKQNAHWLPEALARSFILKYRDAHLWELSAGVTMVTAHLTLSPIGSDVRRRGMKTDATLDGPSLSRLVSKVKKMISRELDSRPKLDNITVEIDYDESAGMPARPSTSTLQHANETNSRRSKSSASGTTDQHQARTADIGSDTESSSGDESLRHGLLSNQSTSAATRMAIGRAPARLPSFASGHIRQAPSSSSSRTDRGIGGSSFTGRTRSSSQSAAAAGLVDQSRT